MAIPCSVCSRIAGDHHEYSRILLFEEQKAYVGSSFYVNMCDGGLQIEM